MVRPDSSSEQDAAPRLRSWALLLIPVVFFALLEAVLVWTGFGSSYPLFIEVPGYESYLTPNPDVGHRYFQGSSLVPGPSFDPFLASKPENGFRLVLQGGSSAAGFPYGHGGSIARMLEQRLDMTLSDREVEVVNTGIDAVSSYALLDFADEILDIDPDAVLVYAGHNEYYGALGVGSSQSLGRVRPVVRLMLALDRFRTVQALREGLAWIMGSSTSTEGQAASASSTLMEEMARDREIGFQSDTYRAGVRQYEANLEALACRYRDAGVPVFLATLVSNERDMPPLMSGLSDGTDPEAWKVSHVAARRAVADRDTVLAFEAYEHLLALDDRSADAWFEYARLLEASGRRADAAIAYAAARDRDQLPFRAPSEMNRVIREVADRCGSTMVDSRALFARLSPSGVPGSSLILEHVHPNVDGYFLIAEAFYRALEQADMPQEWDRAVPSGLARSQILVTALDSALASVHIRRLLNNWPFQDLGQSTADTLRVESDLERLAVDVLRGSVAWTEATAELGSMYEARGQYAEALRVALTLTQELPFSAQPVRLVGSVLVRMGRLGEALGFFERANGLEETAEGLRMEGQMLTRLGRPEDGLAVLEDARSREPDNPAILYDVAVTYLALDRPDEAREAAIRLREVKPDDPGALRLLDRLGS